MRQDHRWVYGPHMSRYHDAGRHVAKAKRIRPQLEALLPTPCLECGGIVNRGDRWHIAHITPAALGGSTTLENVGVAHVSCNTRAGALLGNALHRRSRRAAGGIREW